MAAFSANQRAFISTYAGATGLNPGVVAAQVAAEEPVGASQNTGGAAHGPQNWLNIGITDTGPMGAGNSAWNNPVTAAKLSAAWATGKTTLPGFGHAQPSIVNAITSTIHRSPAAQIAALQHSGWATSGYGDLPSLYNTYGHQAPPASNGGNAVPGMSVNNNSGGTRTRTTTQNFAGTVSQAVPTFDQAGYDKAVKGYIAGNYLRSQGSNSPYSFGKGSSATAGLGNIFPTSPPSVGDFTGTKQVNQTIKAAQNSVQRLAGSNTNLKVHPGALSGGKYVNPFLHATGKVNERIDQGQDFSMQPGAPILAIGDSKVLGVISNWYNGQPYYAFKLLNGPQAGKNYYVAEQITPLVHVGQIVHAGDPIAKFASSGTGIEMGWAGSNWQQTLAQAQGNTGDSSHGNAPAGIAFHAFLRSLGANV